MKYIVGISGVKTSGKSSLANLLKQYFNFNEQMLAYKLKLVSSECFGLPFDHFEKQEFKEVIFNSPKFLTEKMVEHYLERFNLRNRSLDVIDKSSYEKPLRTPREILTFVGTQVLRKITPDIHCYGVDISQEVTVITDVRFFNELQFFNKKEGRVFIPIYVKRDCAEALVDENSHESEKSAIALKDHCFVVENSGKLSDGLDQLVAILDRHGVPRRRSDAYIRNCVKTESNDFEKMRNRLSDGNLRLLHSSIGLTTEVGEFADSIKKHIFYGRNLDRVNLMEELGDVLWYVSIALSELGYDYEQVMTKNIKKLKARYEEAFNQEGEENRDIIREREILENK